jgi:hypothetical protein
MSQRLDFENVSEVLPVTLERLCACSCNFGSAPGISLHVLDDVWSALGDFHSAFKLLQMVLEET